MKTKKKLSSARSSSEIEDHDDAKMEVSTESSKRKEPLSAARNPPATKKKDTDSEKGLRTVDYHLGYFFTKKQRN
nr:uncharacterized protein LOC109991678 isoform X2 [Labrus bergylta]